MTKGHNPLAAYLTVTVAYWAFMLTDGALRMLVLLHFHTLGFSAISLAYLFLVYEFMGIITNLSAGWIAARFGLTSTLYVGLGLQVIALITLTFLDASWPVLWSVIFVMLVQGISGIAKDLSKMSAKSAIKILTPDEQGTTLFKWVAILTGSKNAVKGLGFLLGAVMLGIWGFYSALYVMAAVLAATLLSVIFLIPAGLPGAKKKVSFKEVFSKDASINRLSLARLFLFGARDTWFVVGIPLFFYSVLSDGSEENNYRAFFQIGSFMAVWIIGYGFVQGIAPKLLRSKTSSLVGAVSQAQLWAGILVLLPLTLAILSAVVVSQEILLIIVVLVLLMFGVVFAINSSLHSYLILAFSSSERVTMDVGFYYMSNAAGRLLGTLLSGVSYSLGGLSLCLMCSALMCLLSWLCMKRLSLVPLNSS